MSAVFQQAQAAHKAGNYPEAERLYRVAIAATPGDPHIHRSLAVILLQRGEAGEAEGHIVEAIRLLPDEPYMHQNHALVLSELGRQEEAIAAASQALALKPDYALAFFNRGNALGTLGRFNEALGDYRRALELGLRDPALLFAIGHSLAALGRNEEAVGAYERAIMLNPDYIEAIANRGILLKDMGRKPEALAAFARAIALNPDIAQSHNMLGTVLFEMRRFEEAIKSFEKAVALRPDYAKAWLNFGNLWSVAGRPAAAESAYARALSLDPGLPYIRCLHLHAAMQICDWTDFSARTQMVLDQIALGEPVQAFALLSLPSTPEQQRRCAENFARDKCPPQPPLYSKAPRKPGRLRIAYVANVFREHAVSLLIAEMLERHDRDEFEIIGIANGLNDNSPARARMIAACEQFHDLRELSDRAIAERMTQLGVDIAIDLDGYTEDARTGIFSYRPAPLQANFLGYPGTLGAPYIDYIIGDGIVTPDAHAAHFSEKIIRLPHAYQPNSTRPDVPAPTRAEAGLPDNAFVFGCFNNNFKIAPETFDVWMRILSRVEDSVLWLLSANNEARANLSRQARSRGVDPARLVFAPRTDWKNHLARQPLMGLFLDTFIYGAHTTASDALWAGVPIVTMLGKTFPARVAASLVTAAGIPELITTTAEDYEELAVALATDRNRLAALKHQLRDTRTTVPLFDAARFAHNLESAYRRIWAQYESGKEPESFTVQEPA